MISTNCVMIRPSRWPASGCRIAVPLGAIAGLEEAPDLFLFLGQIPSCGDVITSGTALASQPTLSRLENAPTWRELARMAMAMIELFCGSFRFVPKHMVLDIDDTTDRVHGGQQLSLFNTHAGGYCFQPIHIYDAATGKPVCFLLRPGKRPSGEEAAMVLRHVIRRIRANWPRVAITVRGDGHYGKRCHIK